MSSKGLPLGVAASKSLCEDAEFQTELLEHFFAPLIDQGCRERR